MIIPTFTDDCSGNLNNEFNNIENSFLNLLYPKPFIQFAKSKALKIHKRKQSQTTINTPSNIIRLYLKHIILPSNSSTNIKENTFNNLGIKTAISSSKTIRNLLNMKSHQHIKSNAGVYSIPCNKCEMKYDGETARNLQKGLYEHQHDIRLGNSNNTLFLNIYKTNHNLNFNAATMVAHIHNKRLKQIFEDSTILLLSSIITHPMFFQSIIFLR